MVNKKVTSRKVTRQRGRPRKSEPVVTLALLARIEDLYLRGFSLRKIGILCKISAMTAHRHIEQTLRPRWKEAGVTRLEDDLARIAMLERVAWQAWEDSQQAEIRKTNHYVLPDPEVQTARSKPLAKKSTKKTVRAKLKAAGADMALIERSVVTVTQVGSVAYLEIVKWCIEFRAKLGGYFEKDTAGASGELIKVVEVVIDHPEQIPKMMDFQDYERRLVFTDRKVIGVDTTIRDGQ